MNGTPAQTADLCRLQQVWEGHAKDDPLWAILSSPDKRGGKWDFEEFLHTGRVEIATLLETLATHGISFDPRAALDFGCGVGRLAQALAEHFSQVCAVDISPTMIQEAQRLNRHPGTCRYFLNESYDLQIFDVHQFSFIYSNIVLQHIPPPATRSYLQEFSRVLEPGGLLVFQLPARFESEKGLPEAAFAASIVWTDPISSFRASTRPVINVRVKNTSPAPWDFNATKPVMLGNHWLAKSGEMLRYDDGRSLLPSGLEPNEEVELSLQVTTPQIAGEYVLELDLVQESVAWFGNKGSTTATAVIDVSGGDSIASLRTDQIASRAEESLPASKVFENFSMHVIPRDEVVELLDRCGLRLEFILQSDAAGPGYLSYTYFARKRS